MLEIDVRDINNEIKEKVKLPVQIFKCSASESVVHTAVRSYLANQRQGTHATKTRGLVRGGGKKPWKQKHTGRSRHGSSRSPLWKGGGTTFGPQPRDYSIKLPKKFKKVALYKALTMKLADGEVSVIDAIQIERPKTKQMVEILGKLGFSAKTVLLVLPAKDNNVVLSARNIPKMDVIAVGDLNAYHVASYAIILFTLDAMMKLQNSLSQEIEVPA